MVSPAIPPGGLAEGSILAGKYRIGRTLGAGGMCLVYEAEHVHLRQAVALKLLKPDLAKDPTAVARFQQEAQAAAKLRSTNVARVHDVDKLPDGQPYITMELLVGHDLGTELQRRFALPIDLAVDYVSQAASGISEAHTLGIVHRDLKPENLFLTELGEMTERRLLKILDFGIAKNVHEGARKLTAPDAVFGTVDYMSPEQIRSASTVDHRTDLWSLGVILYELLTGHTPFNGDARSVIAQIVTDPVVPPTRWVPTLPPALVAVTMRALAKDPNHRFQSADELRNALAPFTVGIEPIADVVARLPPATVPRRSVESATNARDQRTNLSFETNPKPWPRRALAVPLLVSSLVILLGMTWWKRDLLQPHRAATVDGADAPPPAPIPMNAPPAATTASILGVSAPADPPSATSPTPPPTHLKGKPRPAPAHPPASSSPTPDHPPPPPTALPKYI